jgi:exosortase H (IPTLxxWG-CTERM-specific)
LSPTTSFVFRFAGSGLAQFAIMLMAPVRPFIDGFSERLASSSAWLIHIFGGSCTHDGAILSTVARDFSMRILDGCNGLNVVVLLWSAMLAYPAKWKWRWIGLASGLIAIQSLNLVRLISLFYLGQYSKSIFEFAHLYLWETLIIIDAMLVFGVWTRTLLKR